MKFHIDLSLFYGVDGGPQSVYGNLKGSVALPAMPAVGDCVNFMFPRSGLGVVRTKGFTGSVQVEQRIFVADSVSEGVQLLLEPLIFESAADAARVGDYLARAFGLFLDVFE